MPTLNIEQTLKALAESQDHRLAPLYQALLIRIRHGIAEGSLEEVLGCKAPGTGKHDAFGAYQVKVRNENLIKAIHYCAGNKPNKYHAASRRLVVELSGFRKKYPLIVNGTATVDSELEHYLFQAALVDPCVFDRQHGTIYELVNPRKNLKKHPIIQVTRDLN